MLIFRQINHLIYKPKLREGVKKMNRDLRKYLKWKRALEKIWITPELLVKMQEAAEGKSDVTELLANAIARHEAELEHLRRTKASRTALVTQTLSIVTLVVSFLAALAIAIAAARR